MSHIFLEGEQLETKINNFLKRKNQDIRTKIVLGRSVVTF